MISKRSQIYCNGKMLNVRLTMVTSHNMVDWTWWHHKTDGW